ncbi:MAG: hypothetical protein ISR69_00390 [Gammaproteobacteria bacterium]|nr:hypothetical protein [Gammaproteobacteria bacterium]
MYNGLSLYKVLELKYIFVFNNEFEIYMIVIVATEEKINTAFNQWINEQSDDERKILFAIYQEFMASSFASEFHTVTGLICYSQADWQQAFELWRDREIQRTPQSLEKIRYWSIKLSDLIYSDWSVRYKLVVKECFDEEDIGQPYVDDMLDQLIVNG